jgi:hypothetical protein
MYPIIHYFYFKFGGNRIKPKIEYKPPPDNIRVIYSTSVKYWNDISVWAIMGYMSDKEKDPTLVLSRKKIAADAEGIASVVFKSFE